jgi:hypothetical protein
MVFDQFGFHTLFDEFIDSTKLINWYLKLHPKFFLCILCAGF